MPTTIDLTGRTAIITGGSAGIGLAIAKKLAESGASVSIWGRSLARLESAAATLSEIGPVRIETVNVADEQAVIDATERTFEAFGGRLDVVVANAGIGDPSNATIAKTTTPQWQRILDANLFGTMWLFREAAKRIIPAPDQVSGSFIATVSLAALEATPRNTAYGASKAAQLSLVKGSAVELARYGIRVNAICPGWIDTDMTEAARGSERLRAAVDPRIPARRWGDPDDIAGAALYLASDLSVYQTGTTMVVDGGYSIF